MRTPSPRKGSRSKKRTDDLIKSVDFVSNNNMLQEASINSDLKKGGKGSSMGPVAGTKAAQKHSRMTN